MKLASLIFYTSLHLDCQINWLKLTPSDEHVLVITAARNPFISILDMSSYNLLIRKVTAMTLLVRSCV